MGIVGKSQVRTSVRAQRIEHVRLAATIRADQQVEPAEP